MLDSELKSKINLLWNKFWSGGISNPLQAIEQMSYLIFMKRLEDEDVSRDQNAKLLGNNQTSIFKGNEDCKWSIWTEMPAEQMLKHVRDKVFGFFVILFKNCEISVKTVHHLLLRQRTNYNNLYFLDYILLNGKINK